VLESGKLLLRLGLRFHELVDYHFRFAHGLRQTISKLFAVCFTAMMNALYRRVELCKLELFLKIIFIDVARCRS
jgi:hypothetical protein